MVVREVQINLQFHRSLAKAVTEDSEVTMNSRTLHTIIVSKHFADGNVSALLKGRRKPAVGNRHR
jgi:hypothetical protein